MRDYSGEMLLIDNYGIGEYKSVLDALLDNGYCVTVSKEGLTFHLEYSPDKVTEALTNE